MFVNFQFIELLTQLKKGFFQTDRKSFGELSPYLPKWSEVEVSHSLVLEIDILSLDPLYDTWCFDFAYSFTCPQSIPHL